MFGMTRRATPYCLAVLAAASVTGCGSTAQVDQGPPVVREKRGSLVVDIASLAAPHTLVTQPQPIRGGLPGKVVISNRQGHVVAVLRIKAGGTGGVRLGPGVYTVGYGPHVPRWARCGRQSATVRPGRTTFSMFFVNCGVM
jgi:hypothetical protein